MDCGWTCFDANGCRGSIYLNELLQYTVEQVSTAEVVSRCRIRKASQSRCYKRCLRGHLR